MNLKSLFLLSSLSVSPLITLAEVIYTTTFPDAVNTIPAGWNALIGGTGSTTTNGWHMDSGNDYRYTQGGSGGGLSNYTGAVSGGFTSTALEDVTIEATFRKGADGYLAGIVGRGSSNNTFYHTRLAGNDFQLYRANAGTFTQLGSTVTLSGGDIYTSGLTYRILLDMQGTQITARLFDELDSEIGEISVNDNGGSALSSGYAGLRAQSPVVYESFQITAIPEASTTFLLLLGFGLIPFARLSRHKY